MTTTWDEAHVRRTGEGEGEEGQRTVSVGRVGTRPQLSVVFRKRDGSGQAFAYAHLYRIGFVDVGRLEVQFSDHLVAVEGRNLGRLFRYLCDHRASQVWEADERAEFAAEADEAVERIVVRELHPGRGGSGRDPSAAAAD